MDKVKDMASKATGGSSGNTSNTTGGGSEDYGDKGLDAAEKKMGYTGNRETNEKVADAARTGIEKSTGKDIPDKYSN